MSRIDRETVEKVASLAHLKLSDEELSYYQGQLDQVLDFIQVLDTAVDNLPVDWRADLAGASTPERLDKSVSSTAIERVLSCAPRVVGTAFQVPKIIE
ncbi:MAG: Asp-tRNA(Asn)/Glu-tRNA(Gln) amidotransferase subunit GatC [Proteobacteria bacterium]|nr:Asp-tRNA(Asn)/Glu-tRNA(Gln) amidotransferase subunit GatC [Pseudomonadota bacterium]